MDGKKWSIANTVLGVIGGLCGVIGIFTAIKSESYEQDMQYKELETRYGLTPVVTGEEAE